MAGLIKVVLIKNRVSESINPVKTLDDLVKDILKDEKKQNNLNLENVVENIQGRNRSVWVHYRKCELHLSQPDYPKRI